MHQKIEGILHVRFWTFFEHSSCEVYQSPYDVRLIRNKGEKNQEVESVVQPNICIICDEKKLDDVFCIGTPDLILGILSDSTAKEDYNEKFNLYEENEVKEYWIDNLTSQNIGSPKTPEGGFIMYSP